MIRLERSVDKLGSDKGGSGRPSSKSHQPDDVALPFRPAAIVPGPSVPQGWTSNAPVPSSQVAEPSAASREIENLNMSLRAREAEHGLLARLGDQCRPHGSGALTDR